MVRTPRSRRRILNVAALGAVALLLGACSAIPERAWVNGAAMGPQPSLQMRNLRDMSAMRATYYSADPVSALYRKGPYQPFMHWRR